MYILSVLETIVFNEFYSVNVLHLLEDVFKVEISEDVVLEEFLLPKFMNGHIQETPD